MHKHNSDHVLHSVEPDGPGAQSHSEMLGHVELLAELSAMAHVGLWEFDPKTGQGSWTPEVARIHEVDPSTPTRADFGLQFYQGEHRRRITLAIDEAVRCAQPYDLELELITAQGNRKWIRTKCRPIVADGEVVRLQGVIQDITDRKAIEQRLLDQRDLMQSYLDTAQVIMLALDRQGHITMINRTGCAVLGYEQADLLGRSWFDMLLDRPEEKAAALSAYLAAMSGESPSANSFTCNIAGNDGQVRRLDWRTAPLRDRSGAITGALYSGQDVTEQEMRRNALEENETKLRLFIEHAPAALAMFDRNMRYLAASRRWMTDYALEGKSVIGQSHYDVFPEITDRWRAFHRRGMNGEAICRQRDQFIRKDGTRHYENWEIIPWRTNNDEVGGILIFSENITSIMQFMKAAEEREARYLTLFRHSPEAIIVSENERILLANDALLQLLGARSEEEVTGKSVYDIVAPQYHQKLKQRIAHTSRTALPLPLYETQFVRMDGQIIDVEVRSVAITLGDKPTIHTLVRDISDRKTLERQLIDATTAEQVRIGAEIHDSIGQELTAMDFLTYGLERQIERGADVETVRVGLAELGKQVRHTLKAVRLLAKGLSPAQIGPTGLPGELARLAADMQAATGTTCLFTTSGVPPELDETSAVHLYRIAQEAVTNAIKHSQADQVEVRFERDSSGIRLSVIDNGIGMEPAGIARPGVGLKIMRYRASLIGADLTVVSDSQGTRIVCSMSG